MNNNLENQNPYPAFVLWLTKSVNKLSFITITLLIFIGCVILIGGKMIEQNIEESRNGTIIRETTLSLLATAQEMRRREKDFFLRRDNTYADKYYLLSDTALRIVDKIKDMNDGEKYYNSLTELGGTLQLHNQQLGLTILTLHNLGINNKKGLLGELDKTRAALESIFNQLKADPKIYSSWQAMQMVQLNYLIDGELKDKNAIAQLANKTKELINQNKSNAQLNNQAILFIDRYVFQFNNVVLQYQIFKSAQEKLTTIFRDFELIIDNIIDNTRIASRDHIDTLQNSIYYWTVFVTILALLTALMVVFIAIVIVRKVAKYRKHLEKD